MILSCIHLVSKDYTVIGHITPANVFDIFVASLGYGMTGLALHLHEIGWFAGWFNQPGWPVGARTIGKRRFMDRPTRRDACWRTSKTTSRTRSIGGGWGEGEKWVEKCVETRKKVTQTPAETYGYYYCVIVRFMILYLIQYNAYTTDK